VVDAINASGYGLTFGIHSRLDDRVEALCNRARVGNIYVNRNQIGAVVGVQPFGGEGLSGTGPKAGGPQYLTRFTRAVVPSVSVAAAGPSGKLRSAPTVPTSTFVESAVRARDAWDARADRDQVLHQAVSTLDAEFQPAARAALAAAAPFFEPVDALPGPTGESNHLTLHGRGIALCLGGEGGAATLVAQAMLALAAGNTVALGGADAGTVAVALVAPLAAAGLPDGLIVAVAGDDASKLVADMPLLGVVVLDGDEAAAAPVRNALAQRDGQRVPLVSLADGLDLFATERVVSIDTTASGGNASLLTLSE